MMPRMRIRKGPDGWRVLDAGLLIASGLSSWDAAMIAAREWLRLDGWQ